jgi:hypothetical protein
MELPSCQHLNSMKCFLIALFLFSGCGLSDSAVAPGIEVESKESIINVKGVNVMGRFNTPEGYLRLKKGNETFAAYLRNLPLRANGKKVALFNGSLKGNQNAQAAVIKMDVGTQDLQQCADAVMRLRAEYLYKQKKYDELHFNFTNGFNAKYTKWVQGYCPTVKGNSVKWKRNVKCNSSYVSFRSYMNWVFMYAGTASLEKELKSKELENIQAGDVFIKGGHPGHAVIVVDVAVDEEGDKIFMLAQSYMPAQEIHILKNPSNKTISPWYKVSDIEDTIETPEWTFYSNQLRTFE